MEKRASHPAPHRLRGFSPRIQLILYSSLLVATPFILLRNYLQDAIGRLSHASFTLAGHDIPWIPATLLLAIIAIFFFTFSRIRRRHFEAAGIIILMTVLAQTVADIYYDHDFYELQQNWHYIAYGIFAWFMLRDQKWRHVPQQTIILRTFLLAIAYSAFDETFQFFISSRVFDVGDIAKDTWGSLMGIALINIGFQTEREPFLRTLSFRSHRLKQYVDNPFLLFVHLVLFGIIFLTVSSLLTEHSYIAPAFLIPIMLFLALFALLHLTAFPMFRKPIYLAVAAAIIVQAVFFFRARDEEISVCQPYYVVYRGIPMPLFDVIIFPDGGARFVDKKPGFTIRDKRYLMKTEADIILIGTGFRGQGGLGFPSSTTSQFIFNGFTRRATQVIRMPTPEACRHFNSLKRAGKSVVFVVHQDNL